MFSQSSLAVCAIALSSLFSSTTAHTVITYPGWRGDNLHSNGTVIQTNGLQPFLSANDSGTLYPYG